MSPNEHPSLANIPRELQQQILKFAFEDAIAQDFILNNRLRSNFPLRDRFPNELMDFLAVDRKGSRFEYERYAPQIYDLAVALDSAFPNLFDDIQFVLGRGLEIFDKENVAGIKKYLSDLFRRSLRLANQLPSCLLTGRLKIFIKEQQTAVLDRLALRYPRY